MAVTECKFPTSDAINNLTPGCRRQERSTGLEGHAGAAGGCGCKMGTSRKALLVLLHFGTQRMSSAMKTSLCATVTLDVM